MLIVYPTPHDFESDVPAVVAMRPFVYEGLFYNLLTERDLIEQAIDNTPTGGNCHVVLNFSNFREASLRRDDAAHALRMIRSAGIHRRVNVILGLNQVSPSQANLSVPRCLPEQADEVYVPDCSSTFRWKCIKFRGGASPQRESRHTLSFDERLSTRTIPALYMFKVHDYSTALFGRRDEHGFYVQRGDGEIYHYENDRILAYVRLDVAVDFDRVFNMGGLMP